MHHRSQLGFYSPDQAAAAAAGSAQAASSGSVWSSIIGGIQQITQPAVEGGRSILDSISASYLNYRGTRDAQKEALERARQGLPPIEAVPGAGGSVGAGASAGGGGKGGGQLIQGIDNNTLLIGGAVMFVVVALTNK